MYDREIDLAAYLPDTLKNITEIRAIMEAESPEIEALWRACGDALNDQFISTATENGIARYEKMLNISPSASDTLEDRRFRLLTQYSERVPYTRRSLEALIKSLCGEDAYWLFDTNNLTFDVYVAPPAKKQVESIKDALERILPYNMAFYVHRLYNAWSEIATRTWSDVATMTWAHIKEEVIS